MSIASALASISRAEAELRLARLAFPKQSDDAVRAVINVELQALASTRRHLAAADIVGNGFGDPRLPARFWAKVAPSSGGCWEWTGAKNEAGYGYIRVGDRVRRAHCVIYETLVGPIPDGYEIAHSCWNRACVRLAHLEPLPPTEHRARDADVRAMAKARVS